MNAACEDAPTPLFFDDIWPGFSEDSGPGPADLNVLEMVREHFCRECPARRMCLEMVMEDEDRGNDGDRFGLYAYLTPGQRRSVKKRRALRCGGCGVVRDPVLLASGIYRCPVNCGEPERRVDFIPIDGDRWTKRHTALARKVLTWIVDNVEVGGLVPPASTMSETLEARRQDMGQVYAAFVADGTLDREGPLNAPVYRRRWATGSTRWTPRFMPAGVH